MTHEELENKVIEQIGIASFGGIRFEANEAYRKKLTDILTVYRSQVLQEVVPTETQS